MTALNFKVVIWDAVELGSGKPWRLESLVTTLESLNFTASILDDYACIL